MRKIRTVVQVLLLSLVAFINAASAKEGASRDGHATNVKAARAYQAAINYFVDELDRRAMDDESKAVDFMSMLTNYRSEVRVEKNGYCVYFSPKEFDDGPVFGGAITYCFDESGALLSTMESR